MNLKMFKFLFFLMFLGSYQVNLQADSKMSPEFASFWGGINRSLYWGHNKGELFQLKLSAFGDKIIPTYIRNLQKPAPVIILFLGIFGRPDSYRMGNFTPHMIDQLETLNTHLIVVPNLISPTYLKARPLVRDLSPWEAEGKIQSEIVHSALKMIKNEQISSLHVVAESLGVWQSVAFTSTTDLKIQSATFLWPALNLVKSIHRFDNALEENQKIYDTCSYWRHFFRLFLFLFDQKNALSDESQQCLGAYGLIGATRKTIMKVAKEVLHSRGEMVEIPRNFSQFIKTVEPQFWAYLEKYPEQFELYSWQKLLRQRGIETHFYSSQDDFLNDKNDWNKFSGDSYLSDKIQLYSWGGHSGLLGLDWQWERIKKNISQTMK